MMGWNDILKLPASTLAGERSIYKTQVVTQGNLTKTEEKKLAGVAKLTLFASLQKSNTYMLPVKNDDYDIEAIIVLHCELKSGAHPSEIAALLHKVFPNPTVILFDDTAGRMGISAAIKRKSRAEHGAVVVETVQGSGLFRPESSGYDAFLAQLSYDQLPQTDLLGYMDALSNRVMLSKTIPTLGFYPRCKEAAAETFSVLVKQLESLKSRIGVLQTQRKDKETTLAESTKIRMQIKQEQQLLDQISKQVKELCHE